MGPENGIKKLQRNLLEEGRDRLIADSPLPGARITWRNRRITNRAEEAGILTTGPLIDKKGRKRGRTVKAKVLAGKGHVGSESWFRKLEPILNEIIHQRGKKAFPDGEDQQLKAERTRVEHGGHPKLGNSTAGKALAAKQIIDEIATHNKYADQQQKRHQRARQTLLALEEAQESQYAALPIRSKGRVLARVGRHLTNGAMAALAGEPRAGIESFEVDMGREVIIVQASTRKVNLGEVAANKLIDGTIQIEYKPDLVSRMVGLGLAIVGRLRPVAVFGKGVLRARNIMTDEILGSTVVSQPLKKLEEINLGIAAKRTLARPLLPTKTVPTYADLGLSGPELEKQSGVPLPKVEK